MRRAIGLLLAGLLLVPATFGAVPSTARADGGDPFLVHACVNPSGLTRIVGPDDLCRSNEQAFHWPKPVGPASVEVDCALGQKIADALESPGNPLTITVKGTCDENVTVARDTVTLQAVPVASGTVNGLNSTLATITVAGQDVLIDGLRVTGGRNGIDAVGAVRLTVLNCTVDHTGRNGIAFQQGANGVVNNCTVQNNPRDGIAVVNGSTAIVTHNMILGNGRRGVHLFQSSNALIGITSTNQDAGNTISSNGGRGISIIEGSSASIGANTISGNGATATSDASQRAGITISRASADIAGGNTITGNAGSGILVFQGSAFLGDRGFISTSVNTITGNGALVAPGFADGGVFASQSASLNIGDANISGNTGNGVTASLLSTVVLRGTSTVNNNTNFGILVNLGSGLLFDTSVGSPVTVTGNTGPGLVCNLPEASAFPFPVAAPGLTIAGNDGLVQVSCTSF